MVASGHLGFDPLAKKPPDFWEGYAVADLGFVKGGFTMSKICRHTHFLIRLYAKTGMYGYSIHFKSNQWYFFNLCKTADLESTKF